MWPPMPSETRLARTTIAIAFQRTRLLIRRSISWLPGSGVCSSRQDRVDVGRDRRERQRDALHPGVVPQGRRAAAGRGPGPPDRSRTRAIRAILAFRALRARSRHAARYSSSMNPLGGSMCPVQSPHSMPAREARASSVSANYRPTVFGKYMKSQILIAAAALACAAGAAAFAGGRPVQETSTVPDRAAIAKMTARFAPVDINADVARLAPGDRARAGEARRGRPHHGRPVPAPGLGRQPGAAAAALAGGARPQAPTAPPPRSCTTS